MSIYIANILKNYQPGIRGHTLREKRENLRACSVLVPLISENLQDENISLLMIRRSNHLRRNPGEYAFPGGMFEAEDLRDPCACALREWHEEMGSSEPDLVLGLLDDFHTYSGLVITPVVCWFEKPPIIEMCEQEVQEVFYAPLNLFQAKNRQQEIIERRGTQFKSDIYYWQEKKIWGATAGIITNLIEVFSNSIF